MKNEDLDLKMQNLQLKIIDTHMCFLPADNFLKCNQTVLNYTILSISDFIFYTTYIKDIKISCHWTCDSILYNFL